MPTTFDAIKELAREVDYQNGGEVNPGEVEEEDGLEEDSSNALDLISDGKVVEDGETPLPSEGGEEEAPAQVQEGETSEKEGEPPGYVQVTDERGRRKKIKVDYDSPEKVRKYVEDAYNYRKGMRKFQVERDGAKKELSELRGDWDALDKAYREQGVAGIVNLLEGKEDAYSQWERQQHRKWETRYNASEDELAEMDRREKEDRDRRAEEQKYRQMQERLERLEKEREEVDLKALESQVNPVFERYSFRGKLGDSADEDMFDELLWDRSLKLLEPYEEAGTLTPQVIRETFRTTQQAIAKRLARQAKVASAKQMKKTQESAKQNVQVKARKAMPSSGSEAEEARDLVKQGNISGIFRNFGKYRKSLGV